VGSAELRELQHAEFDRLWARLHRHLPEARDGGELGPAVDVDLAAHQLVVLIDA
jgi:BetI-type transcriptional repressor, C-terminal